MLRIKHLKAVAFRGVGTELNLPFDSKSLVLYGDSGTGKSSIVEAIEHALTGRVMNLDERAQQISFARHGTHVTMDRDETLAEVTLTDGRSNYVLAKGMANIGSKDVENFLRAAHEGRFILQRRALLEFIENQPKDRYQAMRPFLGFGNFSAFEQALKEAAESKESKVAELKARLTIAESSFRISVGLPDGADLREESVLDHLNGILEKIGQLPVQSENDVRHRIEAIEKLLESYGDTTLPQKVHDCRTRMIDFLTAVPKKEDIQKLIETAQELQLLEKQLTGVFYEQVLTLGKKWIEEEDRENCPLCEQPIHDLQALCQRVQARIDENAKVIAARAELRRSVPSLRTSLKIAIENGERALKTWEDIGILRKDWPFSSVVDGLRALLSALDDDQVPAPDEAEAACSRIFQENGELAKKRAEETLKLMEGKQPEIEKVEEQVRAKAQCQAFLDQFKEIHRQGEQVSLNVAKANRMRRLYETAVNARKQASQEVFESVSKEFGRIYEQFHPGEDLGDLHLDVREHGEGGVFLKGRFAHRANEDPRGLFSEAHLDTLGLAIFLALRKRDAALNPDFRIVVLDDVLTSVDAPHRRRVAEFLLSEFINDFQLVITTHNRLWFEWLIQLQRSRGVAHCFVNKRILSWSLGDGPELVQLIQDYDYVKSPRDCSSHEFIVPIAGRLLEHTLQQLRYTLGLAIQAKPDERYTIGDIWPTILKTARKYKPFWDDAERLFNQLNDTVVIRNWETHSNDWARSLSREEAQDFIDVVLCLFDKVYCKDCNSFLQKCEAPEDGLSCKKGCLSYLPGPLE